MEQRSIQQNISRQECVVWGKYSWSPFCVVNLFRQQDFQISLFVLTESLTRLTLSERVVAYKVARSMLKQTCLPFTYRCNTFKYKYKYTMARSMLLKKICLFCTWPLSILHSNTNAYTTWQKVFKMSTFAVIHSNTHTNAKWGELCLNKRVMSTLYLSSQYFYKYTGCKKIIQSDVASVDFTDASVFLYLLFLGVTASAVLGRGGAGGAVTALTCFGPTQDLSQLSPSNSLNITIIICIVTSTCPK